MPCPRWIELWLCVCFWTSKWWFFSLLTGRTIMGFSRVCTFVLLLRSRTSFFVTDALCRQYPTFQIVTKSFPRYKLSKIGLVSSVFSSFCQGVKVLKCIIRVPWSSGDSRADLQRRPSRAQHDIVAWLRYKKDFQQGSGGATPRTAGFMQLEGLKMA